MFIGPVFTREAITAPRRPQFFVARVLLVAALLGLALTAWQVFVGSSGGGELDGPGDLARFGRVVFELLTPLVLTVAVLFSALFSAAAVSQEKSKGTLLLLLLTDLSNSELVIGRLLASLLTVLVSTLAVAPFLLLIALLGGVDHWQIAWALAVTVAAALASGSLGSMLALWREKTFQALALTAIGLVLWLALGEVIASGVLGTPLLGMNADDLAARVSPWRALTAAMEPRWGRAPALFGIDQPVATGAESAAWFVGVGVGLTMLLNAISVGMVRVWNPSRELRATPAGAASSAPRERVIAETISPTAPDESTVVVGKARGQDAAVHHAGGQSRPVWDNPVLWREVRTWAYGKKVLVVKAAYLVIFVVCALATVQTLGDAAALRSAIPPAALPMAPLLVVSLVLVNALSVTSLTGERDGKSLDLLLTTDLSPQELILGKLGGAFWNSREMIVLPLLLCGYLGWVGAVSGWELGVLMACVVVMDVFAAVLGLHAAMIYSSSRKAIGISVGTLLFLFLGVSTCMRMMLALSNTFDGQLASFLGFIVGGGLALFVALAWRNPSTAMALASFAAPFATFYAIVSFLLGSYSLVGFATVGTFGFATAAMLVPALSEFDIATGSQPTRED
ncbi:ABC transporter permease subunit [Botrimarina mediterranea]|uniref:ABC transporter permease subunit n=1 Tax=Botrimarina mediterranea TaxID=2528022 RepID=UPI00118D1F29|nr:ABC-2 family transporter protein [Planctomycetes bacterium K2D]